MTEDNLKIKIIPTKEIRIYSVDKRDIGELGWCAFTTGSNRLFWIDGYVICMEIHDDAFKYEIENNFFPINKLCYAKLPTYVRIMDVEKGARLPLINVSDMLLFKKILEKIKEIESTST